MFDVTHRIKKKKKGEVVCVFHGVERDVYEREIEEIVTVKKKKVVKKTTKYYLDGIADDEDYRCDKVCLFKDGATRPVKMGSVFLDKCNRFSFLYRFYVFSSNTGADHLFYFRTTGFKTDTGSLYQ